MRQPLSSFRDLPDGNSQAGAANPMVRQPCEKPGGAMSQTLQVVIIKPSKYMADGIVERFRRGFMPNSTLPYMRSMVPAEVNGLTVETQTVDEYVHTDLQYLRNGASTSVGRWSVVW